MLALGVSAYLLLLPGLQQTDIIASVTSIFGLSALAILALAALWQGTRLSRTLHFSFASSGAEGGVTDEGIIAGIEHRSLLRVSSRALFPFFLLEFSPEFEEEQLPVSRLIVNGTQRSPAFLPLPLSFPHRGIWRVRHVRCVLRDQFGFCRFRWAAPCEHAFRVEPPARGESALEVMSSCHRSGDLAIDISSRQGDPFDLKRYHPSDGIRKILWKVYARSRQLISRHPEASFTPEGQVAMFVVAGKDDDCACSEALSYMRKLESLDLELFVSASTFSPDTITHEEQETEDCLIERVWDDDSPGERLDEFVAALQGLLGDSRLDRILIFIDERRLSSAAGRALCEHLAARLASHRIAPVLIVARNPAAQFAALDAAIPLREKIANALFIPSGPAPRARLARLEEFTAACATQHWELLWV